MCSLPSAASTRRRTSSASSTARMVDLGALTPRTVAEAPKARRGLLQGEPCAQLAADDQRQCEKRGDTAGEEGPVRGAAMGERVAAGGAEIHLDREIRQDAEHG